MRYRAALDIRLAGYLVGVGSLSEDEHLEIEEILRGVLSGEVDPTTSEETIALLQRLVLDSVSDVDVADPEPASPGGIDAAGGPLDVDLLLHCFRNPGDGSPGLPLDVYVRGYREVEAEDDTEAYASMANWVDQVLDSGPEADVLARLVAHLDHPSFKELLVLAPQQLPTVKPLLPRYADRKLHFLFGYSPDNPDWQYELLEDEAPDRFYLHHHDDKIKAGDLGAVWRFGGESGSVVAVARIAGRPFVDEDDGGIYVPWAIRRLEQPITREVVGAEPEWTGRKPVIDNPIFANPILLSERRWNQLVKHLDSATREWLQTSGGDSLP